MSPDQPGTSDPVITQFDRGDNYGPAHPGRTLRTGQHKRKYVIQTNNPRGDLTGLPVYISVDGEWAGNRQFVFDGLTEAEVEALILMLQLALQESKVKLGDSLDEFLRD